MLKTLRDWQQAVFFLLAMVWLLWHGAPTWAYAIPPLIYLCAGSVEPD